MAFSDVRKKFDRPTVIASISAVIVAAITAFGTAQAAGGSSTHPLSRGDVQAMIDKQDSYSRDRALLFSTLKRHEVLLTTIDGRLVKLQIQSAQDKILLAQLVRNSVKP